MTGDSSMVGETTFFFCFSFFCFCFFWPHVRMFFFKRRIRHLIRKKQTVCFLKEKKVLGFENNMNVIILFHFFL